MAVKLEMAAERANQRDWIVMSAKLGIVAICIFVIGVLKG